MIFEFSITVTTTTRVRLRLSTPSRQGPSSFSPVTNRVPRFVTLLLTEAELNWSPWQKCSVFDCSLQAKYTKKTWRHGRTILVNHAQITRISVQLAVASRPWVAQNQQVTVFD